MHTETLRCEIEDGVHYLMVCGGDGKEIKLLFDARLSCAVGRAPRTEGFGLEALDIPISSKHVIETNAWLQTIYPSVVTCGDVVGK